MSKKKKGKLSGWIVLALLFLANPNIHIIDILPDFVGYIIIVRALRYASERAPYFAEARSDFKKLALLSLFKLPSLLIQTQIRSTNLGDNDILALFAFSFGVVEIVWTVNAVRHLFDAFYYLGQRSEAKAVLSENPESLRSFAIFFAILKCTAYALPELFLLTKGVDSGNAHTVFNVARLYPYFVVIFVPVVLIFGIITAKKFIRYLEAISEGGAFTTALDSLVGDQEREQLKKREVVSNMRSALMLIAIATIFTLELRFDNLNGVNLFPRVIFGVLLVAAVLRLITHIGKTRKAAIPFIAYSLVALASFIVETMFLTSTGYSELTDNTDAKLEYLPTIIGYLVEFIALIVIMIFLSRMLIRFAYLHTGADRGSGKYSLYDKKYHEKMKTKVVIWAVISIVCGICRVLKSVFKYFARDIKVTVDDPEAIIPVTTTVTEGILPWFGGAVFMLTAIFIGYSFYLVSVFKEDTELKYL